MVSLCAVKKDWLEVCDSFRRLGSQGRAALAIEASPLRSTWTLGFTGDAQSREALKRCDSRTQLRGCAATRGGPRSRVAIVRHTARPPFRICERW